jgi:peroxiredoxin
MKYLILIVAMALSFSAIACNNTTPKQGGEAAEQVSSPTEPAQAETIGVGDEAPDFELKGVDGKMYSLATAKDAQGKAPKGYIVIFTCNTCPFAVASEQRIIDLHNKYAQMGYPVLAIQPNDPAAQPGDSFEAMKERAKELNFPFPYLFDEGQRVYPQYGATRTPEVFLLDQARIVRYHGAIDDSVRDPEGVKEKFLEKAIEALEKGQAPAPASTKAVGCSIKTV